MSCQELVELVTGYLDGALSRRERRRFEEHLAECEGCVAYVEQMRETIRLVARAGSDPEQIPGIDVLLEAFRGWNAA